MAARNLDHPVWEVYNLLRTARLNCKYYSAKLHSVERWNWWIQLIIAITLPTSAIAGFGIWKTGVGGEIWKWLLYLSSSLAFLQPFLKLSDKIKVYDSILTGYMTLDYDLQELRAKINTARQYNDGHKRMFEEATERKKKVGLKEQGVKLDKKLRERCTLEVKRELPAKEFYIPEDI